MKEVIGSIRDLEYRQEKIADIIVPRFHGGKFPGGRGLLSHRTRERFRNRMPFRINISRPRRKGLTIHQDCEIGSVFDTREINEPKNNIREVVWSDVGSDEVSTTVETEDSYVDITIIFDGGASDSNYVVGPAFDFGNAGSDQISPMNNISISFDGGSSSVSSISDSLTTSSSYVTDINVKHSTMVSIVFDGGTSVSNYIFGPSFDCGNSQDDSRRPSNLSEIDEISESSGSCPDNVFIFDGGNCNL